MSNPRSIAQVTTQASGLTGAGVTMDVSNASLFAAGQLVDLYPQQFGDGAPLARAGQTVRYLIGAIAGATLTGTMNPDAFANPPQVEKGWIIDGREDASGGGGGSSGPATQLDADGELLDINVIADGEYLRRVGSTVVSGVPSGGSGGGVGVTIPTDYPATIAGIQAAHDALGASGGLITIEPGNPITSLGTTLNLTNPVTVDFSGNVLKAPAGADPYFLVAVGAGFTLSGASSLLNANAAHGAPLVTLVSTAGFAVDDWVVLGSPFQVNRVRDVVSGTVLRLYRPVSSPLTSGVSVCSRITPLNEGLGLKNLRVDNNGNTNPGLINGFSVSATTTITGPVALGALTLTLASAVGFASGDYILVRDLGQGPGEANGWVTLITGLAGAVVTTNGPVPFPLAVATCTVENVGVAASGANLRPNIGVNVFGCNKAKLENITGVNITGSLLRIVDNYENEYRSIIPRLCGFPYYGTVTPTSGAIQGFYDMGSFFSNCYSENALSWGVVMDSCNQLRGELGSVASYARGTKMANLYDSSMNLFGHNNLSVGVALSDFSAHNDLDVMAFGNGHDGLWLSDQSNTDNYVRVHASGNNALGASRYDAYKGASDLRSIIEVHNEDAVISDVGIIAQLWKEVTYAAATYTASAGLWTVDAGDVAYLRLKRHGKTYTLGFAISNSSVSANPTDLRIALPTGLTFKGTTTTPISARDNGVEISNGMAYANNGDSFLRLFPSMLGALGGATWAISVNQTNVWGQIEFEANV